MPLTIEEKTIAAQQRANVTDYVKTARVLIKLEAMKTENKNRELRGESLAYSEDAFLKLLDELPNRY